MRAFFLIFRLSDSVNLEALNSATRRQSHKQNIKYTIKGIFVTR